MNDVAIDVDGLWKKFHRGELHDSLRDFLPALVKWMLGRRTKRDELGEDQFWALKDVSFQVHRGEAVGIIGANGAGKSTLLYILSRILRPNRGRYQVRGRLRALLEVAAGFHQDLTGRENIYLNGTILGMRKREIDRKLDAIIDFSGVEPAIDTPVKRYSSGMRARLGFSVMAQLDPEVLLVDEVLAVGDAAFRAKCIRHMQKLIRSEAAVVFVSHHLDQVRQLCDRCVVLDQGCVRYAGDVERACDEYMQSLRNGTAAVQLEEAMASGGKLLGVSALDQDGAPSHRFEPHCPLSIQIEYELTERFRAVGIGVNLVRSDGRGVANCNTVFDEHPLPSDPGRHRVTLQLEGLPLWGGDHWIRLRLMDVDGAQTLDVRESAYPLSIVAPTREHQAVNLRHTWVSNGTVTREKSDGVEAIFDAGNDA